VDLEEEGNPAQPARRLAVERPWLEDDAVHYEPIAEILFTQIQLLGLNVLILCGPAADVLAVERHIIAPLLPVLAILRHDGQRRGQATNHGLLEHDGMLDGIESESAHSRILLNRGIKEGS